MKILRRGLATLSLRNLFVYATTALFAGALVSSCGIFKNTKNNMETSENISVNKDTSTLNFAFNLFSKSVNEQRNKAENLVLSPYSAGLALTMLREGANGKTAEELQNALGSGFVYFEPFTTKEASLKTANSIWLDKGKGMTIKDAYSKTLQNNYAAGVFDEDFKLPSTLNKLNSWCDKNTDGMIPKLLDEINPSLSLMLLNALYFKAPWMEQFNEAMTKEKTFFGMKSNSKVPMMSQKKHFNYAEYEGCQIVVLPYNIEGRQIAMIVMLPSENINLNSTFDRMTPEMYREVKKDMTREEIVLSLPKFKANSFLALNNALKALGIRSAYSSSADFSKMTNSSVAVDDVIQKCVVDVNEQGSEAAAVTMIGVRMTCMPVYQEPIVMNVNRPFAFAIVDMQTDNFLFMGKICQL